MLFCDISVGPNKKLLQEFRLGIFLRIQMAIYSIQGVGYKEYPGPQHSTEGGVGFISYMGGSWDTAKELLGSLLLPHVGA